MQERVQTERRSAGERASARGLEDLLEDLVRAHEELAAATAAQREALRRADAAAIGTARDAMAGACAAIAGLDVERRALARAAGAGEEATLSHLAGLLEEPRRGAALERVARLRELAVSARADQRRLHAATESMLRHVRGVVQHMQRSLNHAGVYGRAGRVEPGARVVSGIDLTR